MVAKAKLETKVVKDAEVRQVSKVLWVLVVKEVDRVA